MAADDAAVVVTLRANLKDYETALKAAVRATERAATASEKALSNIGKGAPAGKQISENFAKSAGQIQNDARMLQFQLNDIFSGLASGQGIRAVQQQLGQIAQQMSGGSLAQGARTMATALIGMVNPINLAVVAFGFAASAAVSYFSGAEDGSKDTAAELAKHRDLIRDVAKAYGDALPALKAFNDYLDAQDGQAKQADALAEAIKRAGEQLKTALQGAGTEGIDKILGLFDPKKYNLEPVLKQWEEFKKHVEDGTVTVQEAEKMGVALNETLTKLPVKAGDSLAAGFMKALAPIQELIKHLQGLNEELKTSNDTIADMINKMVQLPSIGGAITGGAGVFNPSQTQMENWKKTQEAITGATSAAAAFIKQEEGFITGAKWDVNAFRVGFGSDTFVDEMGRVQKVTKDTVVTFDQANADLSRRVGEFQRTIQSQIGGDVWRSLSEQQQAALTSIAYNYGQLPSSIVKAIQTGDRGQVANAIAGLSANPDRRKREAELFGGTAFSGAKVEKANYDELIVSINDKIAAQERENAINSDSTATVDEKTAALQREKQAQEAARVEQELNNAAQAQGIPLTDAMKAKNHELAQAYAAAGLQADQLAAAQQKAAKSAQVQAQAAQQFSQQIAGLAQSAIGGLVNDLRNGVEAGEAFNNMLNRIIDSLIQMALQSMFSTSGGGILGSLFGGGGGVGLFEKGGIVGKTNAPRRMVDPRVFAGAPRFASGGMVGLRAGEVPIIAHRGEMVIPKNMVGRGGGNITNNLGTINVDMSATGMVSAGTDQARQFGQNVQKLIQAEMVRESRPGGLLRPVR